MSENSSGVATNGIKIIGERLVPGLSLMMEGRVVEGGAHTIASTLARLVLGPAGVALVAANSLSNSISGKGLLKQMRGDEVTSSDATAAGSAKASAS